MGMIENKYNELDKQDKLFIDGYKECLTYLNDCVAHNSDIAHIQELPLDSKINLLIDEYFEYIISLITGMLISHESDLIDYILDTYPIEGE